MEFKNVIERFDFQAKEKGESTAVCFAPKIKGALNYQTQSFRELKTLSHLYSSNLKNLGLKKGERVLVFLRPQLKFSALVLSLFRRGLVPIFIDPGMGKENLLKAIEDIRPQAMISEPIVHFLRLLYPRAFKGIKHFVTNGKFAWSGMQRLSDWEDSRLPKTLDEEIEPEDLAAILFTSGGTGIPKGVPYTHHIFNHQTHMLQEMFSLNSDDVDLPGFPLFGLFTQAMGMKSCIPNLDPSKPSKLNPKVVVQNILDQSPSFLAGSPAIWQKVVDYCLEKNITLESVKYLVMFGAPVEVDLHKKIKAVIPNGESFTPYGATECLPISNISGSEVISKEEKINSGLGTCVGRIVSSQEVRIIPISDSSLENLPKDLNPLEIGEIVVTGETVTSSYMEMPEQTKKAKVEESNKVWHRMGDLGFFDEEGMLWFCGRKSHSFTFGEKRYFTTPIENIFNAHPEIKRSALVQDKKTKAPRIVVIPEERNFLSIESLKDFAEKNQKTKEVQHFSIAKTFPVDVRHNIKIDRLKLAEQCLKGKL